LGHQGEIAEDPRAYRFGMRERLNHLIPLHLFNIPIQSAICSGRHILRKKKLLEKRKIGKVKI
jgi:translation elongation factor EF-4